MRRRFLLAAATALALAGLIGGARRPPVGSRTPRIAAATTVDGEGYHLQ